MVFLSLKLFAEAKSQLSISERSIGAPGRTIAAAGTFYRFTCESSMFNAGTERFLGLPQH